MSRVFVLQGGECVKHNIADIIDIKEFKKLMNEFYNITNIPYGLLDTEGNIISGIAWQDICTRFHRINGKSKLVCHESDLSINSNLPIDKEYDMYVCKNGLVEAFTPIYLEEQHVGTLIFGQFFFEKPDRERFIIQARKFGFDETEYLKALDQVPIISREKVESVMKYFTHMAKMLSTMGLNQLKLRKSEKLLRKSNELLEEKVSERTSKLKDINSKLEIDIKERKFVEEKLKKSEEEYRRLIELLPYGVCVYKDGIVSLMNSTGAKYFGYDNSKDLIGKRLKDFFHPHEDYRGTYEKNLEVMKKTGTRNLIEEKMIRKIDGKTIYLETISTFIPYDNDESILVVFRDISERKKLKLMCEKIEQNKKKLKEKNEYSRLRTEFFANLSHELRTPVNIIFSTIQLMELELSGSEDVCDKVQRRMGVMKQNCNRIIRLVNNLIDITKIDSGYLKLEKGDYNIVNIVEDITISVAEYMENKQVQLIFDTESEESYVNLDPNAIERIMLNLLSNSIKFTKPGDNIYVDIYDRDEVVEIAVKDTGIGIPKDKLDLIFDRFRQVDKSLNRNHEGSGIGLSLVKSLVKMHQGEIQVNSEYGEGSEFIITLPKGRKGNGNLDVGVTQKEFATNDYIEKINVEFSDIYS